MRPLNGKPRQCLLQATEVPKWSKTRCYPCLPQEALNADPLACPAHLEVDGGNSWEIPHRRGMISSTCP